MKFTRYFLSLILVCGASSVAWAGIVDFRMNVLDPLSGVHISTQNFPVTFGSCSNIPLPSGTATPDGCFVGANYSSNKQTWTSLDLFFPKTGGIAGLGVDCTPQMSGNIFTSANCGSNGTQFDLIFSGGAGIKYEQPFLIAEYGVPAGSFPDGTLDFAQTPEPSSILLLSTGSLAIGLFLLKRRKSVPALSVL